MFSFHDLEKKLGTPAAYQSLMEIEKVSGIQSWMMATLDPETRLANALRLQDARASCMPLAA